MHFQAQGSVKKMTNLYLVIKIRQNSTYCSREMVPVCTQGVNVCTDFYFNFWLPSHKERNLYICFHLFCNWNGYFNYIKEIVKWKNFSLTNIIAMAFDLKGVCRIHGLITDYIKTIYYVRKLSSSFFIYI